MSNLLDSMKAGYAGFVEDGQYLMLFMVALLLLWFSEDPKKNEFRKYCLVMMLILLFPVTAKILMVYQTAFYDYEDLWGLLPVTALISYGLVLAFIKMNAAHTNEYGRWKAATPKSKEYILEIVVSLVLSAILFLCGTLSLGKTMSAQVLGSERIPVEATEVLLQIKIPAQEKAILLAPDEIMTWARIYSGDIILPYGRNLVEPELSAYTYDIYQEDMLLLHDWINGTLPPCTDLQEAVWQDEMYLSLCASSEYDYMVFTAIRHESEVLAKALSVQKEYALFYETENYVIYKLQ
ncbi:MAG TPA: hypothetical protein VJY54_10340 [Lachnospiraceae bacterium]|nr:hypothetical protein [Lachnospiraceae bacterium]